MAGAAEPTVQFDHSGPILVEDDPNGPDGECPRSPAFLTPDGTPDHSEATSQYHTADQGDGTNSQNTSRASTPVGEGDDMITIVRGASNKAFRQPSKIRTSNPRISPDQGKFVSSLHVSIVCATADATIFYTIDGSEPSSSSTQLVGSVVRLLPEHADKHGVCTLRAIAEAKGRDSSDVVTCSYSVLVPGNLLKVAAEAVEAAKEEFTAARRLANSRLEGFDGVCAAQIQVNWRAHAARSKIRRRRAAALAIQTKFRQFLAWKRVRRMMREAVWAKKKREFVRVMMKLHLKGDAADTFDKDKRTRLCKAMGEVTELGPRSVFLRGVHDLYPSLNKAAKIDADDEISAAGEGAEGSSRRGGAGDEDGPGHDWIVVELMALPSVEQSTNVAEAVKGGMASGKLQEALTRHGLSLTTDKGLRQKKGDEESKFRRTHWRRVFVSDDRFYFWNKTTGKKCWKKPDELVSLGIPNHKIPIAATRKQ